MNKSNQFFFIGTEAELIKIFPVILECQKKGDTCHIIASGQNDLKRSRILDFIHLNGKFIELSREEDIKKNAFGLLAWFIKTKIKAKDFILKHFSKDEMSNKSMIVHGDTVSTLMGALIGRSLNMQVCHVEAGLRSHNLFNPFPEEIDRLLTSKVARIHFAPGSEPVNNLKKVKGKVINTEYNTIIDSLKISQSISIITQGLNEILDEDYFVFVMHRQENLMNKEFVRQVVDEIIKQAHYRKCVFILHKITENKFKELGILDILKKNPNFILLPRVDYFDFMKLLSRSKFVITDGGSNQEELHYMGKPCLIMRKTTERKEGIGENAVLCVSGIEGISMFCVEYKKYQINTNQKNVSPSQIIAESLLRYK